MKRLALVPLAVVAAALSLIGLGASATPALAAYHGIALSAPAAASVGQPVVIRAEGFVAPPEEFWDQSWIEVVAIPGNLLAECPADAGSAGAIAEASGQILSIALPPHADEAGRFANAVGFKPWAAGSVLICAYLYNEVGGTWAGTGLRIDVGGSAGGSAGGAPANLRRPWVTRAGRRLVCHPGTWSNASSFAFNWMIDGHPTKVTGRSPIGPGPAGRGHKVACRVTAYGPRGSSAVNSRPFRLR